MYYLVTHPDAIVVTYHTNNMVLKAHSDASYLSKSNARSCAEVNCFMSNNTSSPPNSRAVLTIAQIIKVVMSLAAEAKIGVLNTNCHKAVSAWQTLEFLGHHQPPTPIQTDNTTALQCHEETKAMDMEYHWLHHRISQKQFRHNWTPGSENKGNYVTVTTSLSLSMSEASMLSIELQAHCNACPSTTSLSLSNLQSVSSRTRVNEPCSPPQTVVLTGTTIWAICLVIWFMNLVVG